MILKRLWFDTITHYKKNVFMVYRTKAYLAGEWTGDTDAIEKNISGIAGINGAYILLMLMQTNSVMVHLKPCTLKDSLRERMKSV